MQGKEQFIPESNTFPDFTKQTLITPTDCASSGDCKWVPMGPPGSLKGLCVYDWDKCKLPPSAAPKPSFKRLHRVSGAETESFGVPPVPKKTVCNMTIQVSFCREHAIGKGASKR